MATRTANANKVAPLSASKRTRSAGSIDWLFPDTRPLPLSQGIPSGSLAGPSSPRNFYRYSAPTLRCANIASPGPLLHIRFQNQNKIGPVGAALALVRRTSMGECPFFRLGGTRFTNRTWSRGKLENDYFIQPRCTLNTARGLGRMFQFAHGGFVDGFQAVFVAAFNAPSFHAGRSSVLPVVSYFLV